MIDTVIDFMLYQHVALAKRFKLIKPVGVAEILVSVYTPVLLCVHCDLCKTSLRKALALVAISIAKLVQVCVLMLAS